jgi:S1-C subfamily serine protease
VQTSGGKVAVGGDVIVAVDGKAIANAEDLTSVIGSKKPGDTITIEVLRATGKGSYEHKTVSVTLAARPNSIKNTNTPEG